MKKHKVLTEKAVNAKVVFRGVVVEIKKVSEQEAELSFPENIDTKELLSYLERFGVLKRKVVTPHLELQPEEVQTEEIAPAQQDGQVREDNIENSEEGVKKEDSTEVKTTNTEKLSQEKETTPPKKRGRNSKSN